MQLPSAPFPVTLVSPRPGLLDGNRQGNWVVLLGNIPVTCSEIVTMARGMFEPEFGDFLTGEELAPYGNKCNDAIRGIVALFHKRRQQLNRGDSDEFWSPEEAAALASHVPAARVLLFVSCNNAPFPKDCII